MDGLGVLSFFNSTVPAAVREALSANSLCVPDIDLFIFHQASKVALDSLRAIIGIPAGSMLYEMEDIGNLVSASIPVALSRALASGRVKPGQRVLLCGFGVGLSWGTALVDL
jgi:3-oxoacyl-[acyl-carrier-protein] synthase-3